MIFGSQGEKQLVRGRICHLADQTPVDFAFKQFLELVL